jgi:hypothetical protein
MKIIKLFFCFVFFAVFFNACQSSKSIQRKIQDLRCELFYELTTPEYLGEIDKTVYLNFIDYSNIDYYTTVEKKGTLVIPLLLFNYSREKFNIMLGEHSLIQPYREFLADALFVECNRSSCFNLKESIAGVLPDSLFTLDVKVEQNQTNTRINVSNSLIIIPLWGETFSFAPSSYQINPAISNLEISVRLMQRKVCLWEKTYVTNMELPYSKQKIDNSLSVWGVCLNTLTECLSLTTKKIVEDISQDLHMIMLGQPSN